MKLYILLFASMFIGACAKSGGGGSAAASKSLWSSWTRTDNALTIVLTGGQLGVSQSFQVTFTSGAKCSCNLVMTGTEASGNFTLSSCAYTTGGTGDPGCSSLNDSGTFTCSANTLKLCDPTCGTYN